MRASNAQVNDRCWVPSHSPTIPIAHMERANKPWEVAKNRPRRRVVLDAAGAAPLPLEVSVAAAAGTSLSGVTYAIQENKNVADGAAKSQAVE
jgi:hypothetical protein